MQNTKNIGVVLDSLEQSQYNFFMINYINYLINNRNDLDFTVFFKNLSIPYLRPNCAIFHVNELWSFNGVVVVPNLDAANIAVNALNKADNRLYLWDLEWLRGNTNYLYNVSVLRKPNLKVIARSKSHAEAIEKYANIKVYRIVEDANLGNIIT